MTPKATQSGAWIFLSHSNKDFEKVRAIRNELEKRGHKPIMFYLKCLENDNALLPDLLRREIAAREWFILCDSPNAQVSQYVRDEVELIKSMEGKTIEVVDLSKELQTELYKLIRISKRATVFLSYSHADASAATRIRQALVKHDYRVWSDEDLLPGSNWASETRTALDEAAKHGFVLVLLSPSLLKSEYCQKEISHALRIQGNIIPITIEKFDWSELPPLIQYISYLQFCDLTTGPFEERIEELIRNLKIRDME